MEQLIKQIEALKFNDPKDINHCSYDVGIEDAIMKIRSQPVIKAKAYYQYETYTHIEVNNADLPKHFRLIDIEILISNEK